MKKVTTEQIQSLIDKVEYHHHDSKVTVCFIHLKSDFIITGVSGVVDRSLFDRQIGEKYAYENAFSKIWELEGYKIQSQ